eukprot:m.14293 g.14293  ORF g.14293 m.14293 type:complete len:796 (-) comp6374_c1_seq1:31-2418(-)
MAAAPSERPPPHISSRDPEKLFELICQIGSGSYGTVQKARIIKTGKLAAIKVINIEDGEDFQDIQNEIAMLEQCKHENIVAYFGSFIKNKSMWICMEFCGAGSVSDMYSTLGKPLEEMEICQIMMYSLRGLEYLHKSHMMHRDIKGGNILLTEDGKVKLADLGVSAQLNSTLSKRKSFIGTPYWIAPEIIAVEMKMGPDGYSSICDVWSLGITAIELAEMAPPMFELHPMRALYLIPKNPPPKLSDKGKWGKDFREWVKTALVKNPTKRPNCTQLLKHSWFKSVKPNSTALEDLVHRVQGSGMRPKHSDVQEFENDSDDEEGTLKPRKSGGAAAAEEAHAYVPLAAGRAEVLPYAPVPRPSLYGVNPNGSAAAAAPAPAPAAGAAAGGPPPLPTAPRPGAHHARQRVANDEAKARQAIYSNALVEGVSPSSPPPESSAAAAVPVPAPAPASASPASSFVLSNVFAGCPLKVLCAASWTCRIAGREPSLYIIVGAETGLYVLETSGDKRELVQVSKRACTWLYVMDEDGMMISVSGQGLVCVHDLNSLLSGPADEIKFKTTKLVEGAKGGRCAVTRTPDTGYTFLCVAVTRQLLLMQWYAPRKKFMKLKDFETPFEQPPAMMELVLLENEPLPVLCVGVTRDKKTRAKSLALVNPNWPPEQMAKHMSAELGWVRVRAGREDVFAGCVKQVGPDRFLVCFSNVATFVDGQGEPSVIPGEPDKIVFETAPETFVFTNDAVIAFSSHRMERRAVATGKITHQLKDKGESFKVVGKEGNIVIETRADGEQSSNLYLLVRK